MKSLAVILALVFPVAVQQSTSKPTPPPPDHMEHRFDDPDRLAKSFDDPNRDAWQMPDRIIAALALKPAARVADIGAGTGNFSMRLARAVPQGVVYAIDIEPSMAAHLNTRSGV
jgi:ubiquinone/menaquinone biosynthesis C-methylase UbiE